MVERLLNWFYYCLIGASIGFIFGLRQGGNPGMGAAQGLIIGGVLLAGARGELMPSLTVRLRRLTLPVYLLSSTCLSVLAIVLAHALVGFIFRDIFHVVNHVSILPSPSLTNNRCIKCLIDINSAIKAKTELYLHNFDATPKFRAALHSGPVVTVEVGDDKHEIAYFGDTVNTAARIESFCRSVGESIVISGFLLSQTTLPAEVTTRNLGSHALAGKKNRLDLFALDLLTE